ncbi:MAG: RagB/SusD family nutrient uptake outer membrane protein [Phaeodactylibacter sp.]|uniref:RagB/SusD family nutrient uptake outer membrane protein n=1 Tax=Phaeodactylibacter sp. TaxID=1940289 RepID=UPI0032EAA42A
MKNINLIISILCLLVLGACTIDEQFDPNGPVVSAILTDAEPNDLDFIAYGAEARMRTAWDTYITSTGTIARELYIFDADPRNTEDLLGKDGRSLDNNTFYLTAPWGTRYQVIKNMNLLLQALEGAINVTPEQAAGYRGYAKTVKALMFLQELMRLNDNGIRVDVADPDDLGPFVSKADAFNEIFTLLDEAYEDLQNGAFHFQLTDGYSGGFDTPEGYATFNRAIAARAATYAEQYDDALTYLEDSFLDLDGDIAVGPKMIFSTASGDVLNPVFKIPGQSGDQIIVHDSYIEDIREEDMRISKFRPRVDATSQDGLNGTHETALYESTLSSIDIIRNEELILIYAEASIQEGSLDDAVTALNVIRNAHGLGDYEGAIDRNELIDEMLYNRRYSFWAEGHRMFDLRRYGLLNADFLSIDRDGDQVFQQFPIPLNENQ